MNFKGKSERCGLSIGIVTTCLFLLDATAQDVLPIEWQKSIGGTNAEYLSDIRLTSDGGYLLAGTSQSGPSGNKTSPLRGEQDLFVAKIGPNGKREWDRSFGHGEVTMDAIVNTADGGFVLGATADSGQAETKSDPGYGERDYWLVKLDALGRRQWDRAYGGSGSDILRSVARTADGGYLLGGSSRSGVSGNRTIPSRSTRPLVVADHWIVKTDALGIKQWERSHLQADGIFVAAYPLPDGGYFFGDYDFRFVKVDGNGKTEWSRSFAPTNECYLNSFLPTPDGGFIAVGNHRAGDPTPGPSQLSRRLECVLVKVNGNWEPEWHVFFGGDLGTVARAVNLTRDGGYVVGASSYQNPTPMSGIFKFDANGNQQWERTLSAGHDNLTAVRETKDGGFILGHHSFSPPLGDKTARSFGNFDFWVVKLGAPANP